jgi:hypothetical protein
MVELLPTPVLERTLQLIQLLQKDLTEALLLLLQVQDEHLFYLLDNLQEVIKCLVLLLEQMDR